MQDPLSPFSARAICLNRETQHNNKSCMNCVLILNLTAEFNMLSRHSVHKFEGTLFCYCNNMGSNDCNCFSLSIRLKVSVTQWGQMTFPESKSGYRWKEK